jgi:mono/diheme cytochrome c family protein
MIGVTKLLLAVGLATSVAVAAQDQSDVKIRKVPVRPTNPSSGKEMFTENCAVCHGLDAKGNGPAVPALKVIPPDLTTLTKNNAGKFPMLVVTNTIRGDANVQAAHGSKDMPIWGELFRSINSNDAVIQLRVHNLAKYIQSLQEK